MRGRHGERRGGTAPQRAEALGAWHEALARVRSASADLRAARTRRAPAAAVTAPCGELARALTALVGVADDGHRLATGPLDRMSGTALKSAEASSEARAWRRRLVEARTARQAHLLASGPDCAVRQPSTVPVDGSVELGPFWPLLDHLPITDQPGRRPRPAQPRSGAACHPLQR